MAADETTEPGAPGADPAAVHREMYRHARHHCRRLIDDLTRDADHMAAHRPSALVPRDVLAEGRGLYDQTAAAAEALLRLLDEPAPGGSFTDATSPDSRAHP